MSGELPTNLFWRGRKAYVRVRVPEDLQHAFGGRTELWRSLGTSDEKTAKRLGLQKLAELQNDWQRIRIHAPAPEAIPPRDLTDHDISRHAAALYESELRLDERRRENLPTDADLDRLRTAHQVATDPALKSDLSVDFMLAREAAGHDRTTRTRLLAELRHHLGTGETSLIAWAADAALARDNLRAGAASPMYRRLCQALTRVWIEAIERTLERDKGVFTGQPADPIVIAAPAPIEPSPASALPGEDILALYDEYQKRNPNGVKPDTLAYGRTSVRLFVESLPKGTGVRGINKAAVRGWLALMRQYPVKAGDFMPLRSLDIRQVIEANKTHGKPVIITRTINKAVTSLSSFWDCPDITEQLDILLADLDMGPADTSVAAPIASPQPASPKREIPKREMSRRQKSPNSETRHFPFWGFVTPRSWLKSPKRETPRATITAGISRRTRASSDS